MSSLLTSFKTESEFRVDSAIEKAWNVIYLKAHHEKQANDSLAEMGVESFLPMRKELHQWSDRKKWVWVPLFSSYLFVNLGQTRRNLVYQLNGFVKFLSSNGKTSIVPQWQIDAIKKVVEIYPEKVSVLPYAAIGLRGLITAGPLAGLAGELLEVLNQKYYLIRLEGLDKILKVAVPEAAFEPIQESADMKIPLQETDIN